MKITGNLDNLQAMIDMSNFFEGHINLNGNINFLPGIHTIIENWRISRNWLLKSEWDNRWKICSNKSKATALKPRGELLISYYKLCERCHSFQDVAEVYIPFKNAGVWFSKLFIELIGIEIDTMLNPPTIYNSNIKKSFLDVERNKSRLLRDGQNPFIEYVVNEEKTELMFKEGGLKLLIDCAIALQEKSSVFRRDYWKPYLNAYSAHIAEMASPRWGVGFTETRKDKNNVVISRKYFIQSGQGRGDNTKLLQDEIRYDK